MKRTLLALALLAPALAVGQEKFTNADLGRPPKADAYTNADLAKLPPLPVGRQVARQALPAPPRDTRAEALAAVRDALRLERELIVAESGYWKDLMARARYPLGDRNSAPRVGPDTAEARARLKALDHQLFLVDTELELLR